MLQKVAVGAAILFALVSAPATAAERPGAQEALLKWYGLVLELVRHTPTYSPPVASRAFAYLGVAAYEAVASGSPDLQSLAGQLNDLTPLPPRDAGKTYDDAVVVNAAMAHASAQSLHPYRADRPARARRHGEEDAARKSRPGCRRMWSRAARPMARRSAGTSSPGRRATAAPSSRTWAFRSNTL